MQDSGVAELKFRDPSRARALTTALGTLVGQIDRPPVSIMHLCGGTDVETARGILGYDRLRGVRALGSELSSKHQLLLVPSRHRAHGCVRSSRSNVEGTHERLGMRVDRAPLDESATCSRTAERDVLDQ